MDGALSHEQELTHTLQWLLAVRRRARTDPLEPEALAELNLEIAITKANIVRAKENVEFLKTQAITPVTTPVTQPTQAQWRTPSTLPKLTIRTQLKHFLVKFEGALKAEGIPEERWSGFLPLCVDGTDLDILGTETKTLLLPLLGPRFPRRSACRKLFKLQHRPLKKAGTDHYT